MPTRNHADQPARILVMGLGGAGCNLVTRLSERPPVGVELVLANTDAQALLSTKKGPKVLFLGEGSTRGLGAGSNHELGRLAAEQSASRLGQLFQGVDMVFLTAGLGGGTGTGAAPIAAREAKKAGALVVAVVTKPFEFEGRRRTRVAEEGVAALEEEVDTLLVLPNQKLLQLDACSGSLDESFKVVDQVLCDAVRGMTEIVTVPGVINLDFADVRAVLEGSGKAIFGMATAATATRAVELALSNPLVGGSPDGAGGCLLNITGGPDMSLRDYSEASRLLQESAAPDAMVLCGFVQDETMTGRARATVVATRVQDVVEGREVLPSFQADAPTFRENDILPLATAALPPSELTAFERRRQVDKPDAKPTAGTLPPPPRSGLAAKPAAPTAPKPAMAPKPSMAPKPTAAAAVAAKPTLPPKPPMPTPVQRENAADRKNGWMNLPAIWRRSRRKESGEEAQAK
ncbi:MAG: cell division protein FtsZ [Vulcanimicrobiota bacterium]